MPRCARCRPGMPGDVPAEERDRPAVGPELAGHQVEERRLARAVRADDQAPLALRHREIHRGGDEQAAEGLRQALHRQRGRRAAHRARLLARRGHRRHRPRRGGRAVTRRHSRAAPGTSPSGMKTTIATKMAPRTKFQRSMYALATFFMMTTSAAPTTGPSRVPAPARDDHQERLGRRGERHRLRAHELVVVEEQQPGHAAPEAREEEREEPDHPDVVAERGHAPRLVARAADARAERRGDEHRHRARGRRGRPRGSPSRSGSARPATGRAGSAARSPRCRCPRW